MFQKILNGFLRSATSESMDVVAFDYIKEEKKKKKTATTRVTKCFSSPLFLENNINNLVILS